MIRLPTSLRWRLQLWYGVLLLALLCGFGFTAFHLERARQFRRVDEALQERLSAIVAALRAAPRPEGETVPRPRPPTPAPSSFGLPAEQAALFSEASGFYYAVWMRGAEPIARSPGAPAVIPRPDPRGAAVRVRGEYRESFLFAAPVDCILVGRSIARETADMRRFALLLGTVGGAVFALGMLGGSWLVARAIRPVEAISEAAVKIAAGDLSERIADTDGGSELAQLAGVLNSTFARLESAFDQQARFTADAAHELRTPISVVLTHAQNGLATACDQPEHREAFEATLRAAQRMRRLIDSLLELARLDAGQEPMRLTTADLASIVTDSISLLRPLTERRSLRLDLALASAPCTCDPDRIAQVVTNLLANAIAYNHDGGEIHIATRVEDAHAIVTVTNTGPGIPPEDLPHIFERFHRVDRARTDGHSGLGLAIAQAIVGAHGGQLKITSEVGGLTTATMQLTRTSPASVAG